MRIMLACEEQVENCKWLIGMTFLIGISATILLELCNMACTAQCSQNCCPQKKMGKKTRELEKCLSCKPLYRSTSEEVLGQQS